MNEAAWLVPLLSAVVGVLGGAFGGRYVRKREAAAAAIQYDEYRDRQVEKLLADVERLQMEIDTLKREQSALRTQISEKDLTHEQEVHRLHTFFDAERARMESAHRKELKELLLALEEAQIKAGEA